MREHRTREEKRKKQILRPNTNTKKFSQRNSSLTWKQWIKIPSFGKLNKAEFIHYMIKVFKHI
jgi:hypothetical protein